MWYPALPPHQGWKGHGPATSSWPLRPPSTLAFAPLCQAPFSQPSSFAFPTATLSQLYLLWTTCPCRFPTFVVPILFTMFPTCIPSHPISAVPLAFTISPSCVFVVPLDSVTFPHCRVSLLWNIKHNWSLHNCNVSLCEAERESWRLAEPCFAWPCKRPSCVKGETKRPRNGGL